jgi:hypothetical protein
MPSRLRAPLVTGILTVLLAIVPTSARESSIARDMREAAAALLKTLDAGQRQAISLPFDGEDRLDFRFTPGQRKGLTLYAMTPPQQEAAGRLLASALSARGVEKAKQIRSLDGVLLELEGEAGRTKMWDGRNRRDPERYHFTIFGTPSATATWGWRYDGHHVSQNWTIVGGTAIASTPQFFGANPAQVRGGPLTGLRVLAAEEDLARTFLASLDPQQKAAAIVSAEAPRDILTAEQRQPGRLPDAGVRWSALSSGQQQLLWKVIEEYAFGQAPALAKARLAQVRTDGLASLTFAWMGSTEKGGPHYYRIQGPRFVIEYDCTQNEANHIHAVWRDYDRDFGRDLLAEHYRRDHSAAVRE